MRPLAHLAALLVALAAAPAAADLPNATRIAEAREQVSLRPADVDARLRLIELLVDARAPEEALSEIALLEALRPGGTRAAHQRARALIQLRRLDEAEAALDARLEVEPLDVSCRMLRAELREERGAVSEAAIDYEAVVAHAPDVGAYLGLARTLERLGDLDTARRRLEEGLHRTGGAVVLRARAYELARRIGAYDAAIGYVDEVLASHPAATGWRVMRAAALADAGRAGAARAELTRALADADARVARRASPLALQERGRVLLALGRHGEARRDLEQALRRAPRLVEARRLLASLEGAR